MTYAIMTPVEVEARLEKLRTEGMQSFDFTMA